MRTTLIIPDGLLEEARNTLGFRSKTDTVVHALREVVRRGRAEELKSALRTVRFHVDAAELRRKDRERAGL